MSEQIKYKRGSFVLYNGGLFRIKGVMWLTTGEPEPFLRLSDTLFVSAKEVEPVTEVNVYNLLPL